MNEQMGISFCVCHVWLFHVHKRYLERQRRIQINIIKMCIVILLSLGHAIEVVGSVYQIRFSLKFHRQPFILQKRCVMATALSASLAP